MPKPSNACLYCSSCKRYFDSQYEFNQHIRDHLKGNYLSSYMRHVEPHSCELCHATFENRTDYENHYKGHLIASRYVCGYCGRNFKSSFILTLHTISCSNKPNLAMVSNAKKETFIGPYIESVKSLIKIAPDKASKSVKDPAEESTFILSSQTKKEDVNLKLSSFNIVSVTDAKRYASLKEFDNKVPSTLRKKNYVCEMCKEAFTRKCTLDTHSRKHTIKQEEKEIELPISPKNAAKSNLKNSFTSNEDSLTLATCVTSHEVKEHNTRQANNVEKSSCAIVSTSGLKTPRPSYQLQNSGYYLRNRKFTCEVCRDFNTCKCPIIVHAVKTTKPLHVCDVCQKSFKDKYKLNRHYLIHTGEKPYVCLNCDKRFTRKDHLKRHNIAYCKKMATVAEIERPFKCDVCSKAFKLKAHLKKHAYTHADKKPHVCEKCGKGYIRKYRFVKHVSLCNKTVSPT